MTKRRTFLQRLAGWSMVAALVAAYGTLAAMAGRFLYPPRPRGKQWLYIAETRRIPVGGAFAFRTPDGTPLNIAHLGAGEEAGDFVALSSVCPHLGCQVHWESLREEFVCPCHNGIFNAEGVPLSGPPADAGQDLARFPLRVRRGLLFAEVPEPDPAAVRPA